VFDRRCVSGISANAQRCRQYMQQSVGLATVFNSYIGYKKAAELAQEAERSGKNIYQAAVEKGFMTEDEIRQILQGEDED
jgi:aspartate ammonia-lyase